MCTSSNIRRFYGSLKWICQNAKIRVGVIDMGVQTLPRSNRPHRGALRKYLNLSECDCAVVVCVVLISYLLEYYLPDCGKVWEWFRLILSLVICSQKEVASFDMYIFQLRKIGMLFWHVILKLFIPNKHKNVHIVLLLLSLMWVSCPKRMLILNYFLWNVNWHEIRTKDWLRSILLWTSCLRH